MTNHEYLNPEKLGSYLDGVFVRFNSFRTERGLSLIPENYKQWEIIYKMHKGIFRIVAPDILERRIIIATPPEFLLDLPECLALGAVLFAVGTDLNLQRSRRKKITFEEYDCRPSANIAKQTLATWGRRDVANQINIR